MSSGQGVGKQPSLLRYSLLVVKEALTLIIKVKWRLSIWCDRWRRALMWASRTAFTDKRTKPNAQRQVSRRRLGDVVLNHGLCRRSADRGAAGICTACRFRRLVSARRALVTGGLRAAAGYQELIERFSFVNVA